MLWLLSKHLPRTASDHITGRQIPTPNSSFSYPGTLVVDTRVHHALWQRGQDKTQSVRLEGRWKEVLQTHALYNPINILGTWELNAHVRQAVGWLEVGKPAQIKQ